MARLKKEVQIYIVRSLAAFNTPTETARLVQEEFKIEVTRQKCEAYDPTKRAGQDLSAELKTELTGAGGGPIQQENTTTVIATPDQIRDTMRKLDDTY